jgi:hypothetical protein
MWCFLIQNSLDCLHNKLWLSIRCVADDNHSSKIPDRKFIGSMLTLWGAILMFTTLAKNFAGMMVLRFILGNKHITLMYNLHH